MGGDLSHGPISDNTKLMTTMSYNSFVRFYGKVLYINNLFKIIVINDKYENIIN